MQEQLTALAENKRQPCEEFGTIAEYDEFQKKTDDQFYEKVAEIEDQVKSPIPSVAFLGKTSTGKSSMINALFGTTCATSPIVCTKEANMVYENSDLQVYDVFGTNDIESYHNVELLMKTKTMHVVVCLYTESVESVLNQAKLLRALKVDVIFVRNKCDQIDVADHPTVYEHELHMLQEIIPDARLMLVSAKSMFKVPELKAAIQGGH